MATKRDTGSKSNPVKKAFNGFLTDFGRTLTLRKNTITMDGNQRQTAISTATSTISCDIQWVNKWNIEKVNVGEVQIGDGILFVKHDADIDMDEAGSTYHVEYGSDYWRLINQVEGEEIAGEVIYKAFLIRLEKQ